MQKAFQKYLPPEVIARNLRDAEHLKEWPLETKHFQFVLILVDETHPQEIPSTLSRVVDAIIQHHAMLANICSSLVVALFGVPFPEGNTPEARRGMVEALLRENGDRIRIAHGEWDGAVGLLGSKERASYGAIIPGFSAVLKTLLETKFGTAIEIH